MSRRYTTTATRSTEAGQIPYHLVPDINARGVKKSKPANAVGVEQQEHNRHVRSRRPRAAGTEWSAPSPATAEQLPEDRDLTQYAFDKMLAILDQDREAAGRKYEVIRSKLQKFFECRGCSIPNELADETINLVARKIARGQEITGDEPSRYFYGVARNVIREYWRRSARCSPSIECLPRVYHPSEDPAEAAQRRVERYVSDRRLERLERSLRALTDENREAIIKYYDCEDSSKISGRRALAREMGIHSNTLRLRVHRIKIKLKRDLDNWTDDNWTDDNWTDDNWTDDDSDGLSANEPLQ
jgi:DNA-directed RNA polymerase specialized sigma24 family protein